jgi:hypothetical protein
VPAKGAVAPGCTVATTLSPLARIVASSLPLKTRRLKTSPLPSAATWKQSLTKPASSAAARRGATSQPDGVFEIRIRSAPDAATAALIAASAASALYCASAGLSAAKTLPPPFFASSSACAPIDAPITRLATLRPLASATFCANDASS